MCLAVICLEYLRSQQSGMGSGMEESWELIPISAQKGTRRAAHGVRVGSWDEIHQSTAEANEKSPGCKEEASYNMKHSQQKKNFK